MSESLTKSAFRAFFTTLFKMFGVALGLIPIILIFVGLVSVDGELDVKTYYNPMVVPNAKNTRKTLSSKSPVILKIDITGMIGTEFLNMHTIKRQLVESREGKLEKGRVKAIIVTINSPGGTVTDSNGIYEALKAYKELHDVPIYAYIDGICASGGMYVACAADKIYASEISVIGSIGVLTQPFFNFADLMDKVGVDAKTLSAGKGKDDLNPFRPWKPDEGENFKVVTDYMYQHFLQVVTTNRPKINAEQLVDTYGANMFPAAKAAEIGFIDQSNVSLNDTIAILAQELGIEDDAYQVISMESKYWFTNLVNSKSPLLTGILEHKLGTNAGQCLYMLTP